MRDGVLRRSLPFLLVTLTFLMGTAAADPGVDINEEDQVIWKNDGAQDQVVNFTVQCGENATVDRAYVWDGNNNFPADGSGAKYSLNTESRSTGKYYAVGECAVDNSAEVNQYQSSFSIDRLNLNLKSPSDGDGVFLGTRPEASIEFRSEMGNFQTSRLEPPRMFLEAGGNRIQLDRETVKSRTMTLQAEEELDTSFISTDFADGSLSVNAKYNSRGTQSGLPDTFNVTDSAEVEVSRWDVKTTVEPSRRVAYRNLDQLQVVAEIMYEGEPLTPPEENSNYASNFYFEKLTDDEEAFHDWFSGGFDGTSNGYGVYRLSLERVPSAEAIDDNLEIKFSDGERPVIDITTVDVQKAFTFEGRVSDSDSRAVETRFNLRSDDFTEVFSTDSRGLFERRILQGEYSFDICFRPGRSCDESQGTLSLAGVEMDRNYSGNVNFDYFSSPGDVNVSLPGIDPINMMTVRFGYPIDAGRAAMKFNPAKADDPSNVKVFECVRYNFFANDCTSGWERIDEDEVRNPPTKWMPSFPVTPAETSEYGDQKKVLFSAYVVGTNSELDVPRIELGTSRVRQGETVDVQGYVSSPSGEVEGANVTVQLRDSSGDTVAENSTISGASGQFELSLLAEKKGDFALRVSAEKDPYVDFSTELDQRLEVYRESELSVEKPGTIALEPGGNASAEILVSNDGQTTFEDVSFDFTPPEGFTFSTSGAEIGTLEPGESGTVEIDTSIPEDHCDPSCVQFPVLEGELSGESSTGRLQRMYEFEMRVDEPSTSGTSSTSEQEEVDDTGGNGLGSPLAGTPTGEFIGSQSPLNIALGLITVFALVLAGAVKKRKSDEDDDRGRARVALQKPQVSPEGSESEIDEVAQAMDQDTKKVAQAVDAADADDEWFEELDGESAIKDIDVSGNQVQTHDLRATDSSQTQKNEAVEQPETSEVEEAEEEEEVAETEETSEAQAENFTCGKCSENFETESGLELHKQAIHDSG